MKTVKIKGLLIGKTRASTITEDRRKIYEVAIDSELWE